MISIKVNVADGVSEDLAALISVLTGPQSVELSEQGGIAARNAAVAYHDQFDQSGGWRGKRYLGGGKGGGGSFGSAVSDAWKMESHDSTGAVISNAAEHYAFKVTGGTITPKRGKYLTIPLVPEARGVRVATYMENAGHKLFRSPSGKALMESTGKGTARSVYALLESVTMGPWAGAVPPDDVIAGAYTDAYRDGLTSILENS